MAYNAVTTNEALSISHPVYLQQRGPVPANRGAIRVSAGGAGKITARWDLALTDTRGATAVTTYQVFYSAEPNIRTPQEMETNGIPAGGAVTNATTGIVSGLLPGAYYVNVLVRGEGSLSTAYTMAGPVTVPS